MIVFWLIVFVLALGAVAFIAWPIAAGAARDGGAGASADDDATLQSVLSAIDRDRTYGLIDKQSADEAKTEARDEMKRRSEAQADDNGQAGAVARRARFAAFLALGATPVAAVLLYLQLGSPQALDPATRTASVASQQAAVAVSQRISELEAQVKSTPDDFETWMALGEEYITAGRSADSARAFAKAVELDGTSAAALGAYGEAMVQEADGAVTGEALASFEKALALDPDDARAQYYLAESRYQVGAVEDAVRGWVKLLNEAPQGAPWFSAVAARVTDAAAEAGMKEDSLGLKDEVRQRIANASQIAAAGGPSDDFDAMIGRIHDGSASFEDWMGAASIYAGRGEMDRAKDILERAAKRYEAAPFVLAEIEKAKAQLEAGSPISTDAAPPVGGVRSPTGDQVAAIGALPDDEQRQMIEGMVAGLAERLKNEPDNLEGWRMLGRSYRVLGRPEDSADAWRQLLARDGGNAEDWRGLAFALLEQRPEGDNTIGDELKTSLEKLREFDPDDPLALYNLGYAAYNKGDNAKAVEIWTRLRDSLPPETPLAPTLDRLIKEAKAG
jgi:cytochrome c-type biogenesis protein CcmH